MSVLRSNVLGHRWENSVICGRFPFDRAAKSGAQIIRLCRLIFLLCLVLNVGGCGRSSDGVPENGAGDTVKREAVLDASSGTGIQPSGDSLITDDLDSAGVAVPPGKMKLPDKFLEGLPTPRAEPDGPTKPGSGGFEMPSPDGTNTQKAVPNMSSETPASGVLKYARWSTIEEELKSRGKITVLDLWSTSCEPCLRELPELVHLQQTVGSPVQCVAVNVDFDGRVSRPPEYYSQRVSAFLESIDASFERYICRTPSEEVFASAGIISIPAVLIYDETGQMVKKFVDAGETIGFGYDQDVLPFINAMLESRNTQRGKS